MYRDLIYKDDLVRSMHSRLPQDEFQWFANVINEQPLVNAQPIVYGEWIEDYNNTYGRCRMKCSVCGKFSGIGGVKSNQRKPFCPNCGARMKGINDEDN